MSHKPGFGISSIGTAFVHIKGSHHYAGGWCPGPPFSYLVSLPVSDQSMPRCTNGHELGLLTPNIKQVLDFRDNVSTNRSHKDLDMTRLNSNPVNDELPGRHSLNVQRGEDGQESAEADSPARDVGTNLEEDVGDGLKPVSGRMVSKNLKVSQSRTRSPKAS